MLTREDRQRLLLGQAAWFGRMGHPVAQKASLDALARISGHPAARAEEPDWIYEDEPGDRG